MNLVERTFLKLAWKRLEGKTPMVKKYGPLVGLLVLVIATVARLTGHGEIAAAILSVGSVVGLTDASPIPAAEVSAIAVQVAASVLAFWGFVRKVQAEIAKARAKANA